MCRLSAFSICIAYITNIVASYNVLMLFCDYSFLVRGPVSCISMAGGCIACLWHMGSVRLMVCTRFYELARRVAVAFRLIARKKNGSIISSFAFCNLVDLYISKQQASYGMRCFVTFFTFKWELTKLNKTSCFLTCCSAALQPTRNRHDYVSTIYMQPIF